MPPFRLRIGARGSVCAGVKGADTVRSRQGSTVSAAHDATPRLAVHAATAPPDVAPGGSRSSSDGGAPTDTGAVDGDSTFLGSLPTAPASARQAFRYPLKNWRVRSRLRLLVLLPTRDGFLDNVTGGEGRYMIKRKGEMAGGAVLQARWTDH